MKPGASFKRASPANRAHVNSPLDSANAFVSPGVISKPRLTALRAVGSGTTFGSAEDVLLTIF